MESELIKGLTQLGGFGLLAAVIFWYSQRAQQQSEQRIKELAESYKDMLRQSNAIIEANTAAMTRVCVMIEQVADHLDECRPSHTVRRTGTD